MEFAKYYNVTNKLNEMLERTEQVLFSYQKDSYKSLFICSDTHDFWISRILEGYNEDFEQEEGKWLVERNKIDKYDFISFIEESHKQDLKVIDRPSRDVVIECLDDNFIIENLILMDDDNGLEGWDNCECNSYNEAVEVIDGGFGIIELTA